MVNSTSLADESPGSEGRCCGAYMSDNLMESCQQWRNTMRCLEDERTKRRRREPCLSPRGAGAEGRFYSLRRRYISADRARKPLALRWQLYLTQTFSDNIFPPVSFPRFFEPNLGGGVYRRREAIQIIRCLLPNMLSSALLNINVFPSSPSFI